MKRFICIVFLLALFLSVCSAEEQTPTIPEANYTHGRYQLIFKTKMISNDCVGNEWSFSYTLDGQTIKSGYTITQPLKSCSFQTIDVKVWEDDKIDDVGTGTLTVAICEGGSGKAEVTITETNGSFKGNKAVWEVCCEVKLVGKQ